MEGRAEHPQVIYPKTEPWPVLTKAKISRRDGPHCLHCGETDNTTIQHRAVKGNGGRNSAEHPANGILLCWLLNVALEQDADLAAWAEEMGWKISTHADPTTVPVTDATTGERYLLDADWTRRAIA